MLVDSTYDESVESSATLHIDDQFFFMDSVVPEYVPFTILPQEERSKPSTISGATRSDKQPNEERKLSSPVLTFGETKRSIKPEAAATSKNLFDHLDEESIKIPKLRNFSSASDDAETDASKSIKYGSFINQEKPSRNKTGGKPEGASKQQEKSTKSKNPANRQKVAAEDADGSKSLKNSNDSRDTSRPADQSQLELQCVEDTESNGVIVKRWHCRTRHTSGCELHYADNKGESHHYHSKHAPRKPKKKVVEEIKEEGDE